ncbi:MAG: ParB N-terminal domain-containing protein [Comamonadaceae bacterium]|nr:ParB N-terminal domain-containing protein [Comamonadaceae bacterium]
MDQLQFHPVSEIFPSMAQAEFDALVADITANGLREPIHVIGDSIIDGRHRYRACMQAGIEPQFVVVPDGTDLNALVISLNLRRRHLSESQRAIVAARLETRELGRPHKDANLHDLSISRAHASELLNVSVRSVANAAKVLQDGTAELIDAVDRGEVAVSTGADLARLPAHTQQTVLTRTPEEIRAIARDVKDRIQAAGVCGASAVRIFDKVAREHELGGMEQIAVVEVIKAQTPPLPTPAQARRIACEGAPGLAVLATDGRYHSAPSDEQDNTRMQQWLRLREGLEPLGTVPFAPEVAMTAIPTYQEKNVTAWLASAVAFLNQFNLLWSQRHAQS